MEISVTIKPGLSPMDRGYVEDLVTAAIETALGGSAECTGGGTLLGEGGPAESDFDIEFDGDDALGVAAACREALSGIPFTLPTTMTVRIDTLDPFEVVVGAEPS